MAKPEEEVELQPLADHLMDFANLGRTVDGTGLVYRTINCVDKRIGAIKGIEAYAQLQHLDFSQNGIKDMAPLRGLPYLLKLSLSRNALANFKGLEPGEEGEEVWPHMTHLDLSSNVLTALPPLPFKSLRIVNFSKNEITTCQEFPGHETIQELDLSGNKLTTLAGLANMPALVKLNLSSNEIEDVNGLASLPALEDFNLADNKLKALEGPWQELKESPLTSIDLSGNQLEAAQPLEVLRNLQKLRSLAVKGNPFVEAAGTAAVAEVLVCHWLLTSIDGQPVTPEQLEEARLLNVARLEEAREKAKKAEEAAAAAAA